MLKGIIASPVEAAIWRAWEAVRGAGGSCGDFAVGVNDFLTVGAQPRLSESVLALEVC